MLVIHYYLFFKRSKIEILKEQAKKEIPISELKSSLINYLDFNTE